MEQASSWQSLRVSEQASFYVLVCLWFLCLFSTTSLSIVLLLSLFLTLSLLNRYGVYGSPSLFLSSLERVSGLASDSHERILAQALILVSFRERREMLAKRTLLFRGREPANPQNSSSTESHGIARNCTALHGISRNSTE